MRLAVRLACACVYLAVPLAAQSVYYLPQVVDGAGLRTTILLTNTGAASANLTIALLGDDGSPRQLTFPSLGSGSQFSLTLQPGATGILQTDGSSNGSAGAATITGSAPVSVAQIVSVYDAGGNLVSESATAPTDPLSGYVIPVDTTGGLNTGVALLNPGTAAANLTFTLFDRNGGIVESAAAALPAGSRVTRMAGGDLFPDIAAFQGTLAIAGSVPVAVMAFRRNSNLPSYTLLTATPQISMLVQHCLPGLADGPAAAGGFQQTSFLLYNLSQKAVTVTLALSQASGAAWVVNIPGAGSNSTFSLQLPPGGSAFWQTDGQGVSTTGAANISSDQPIGVAAIVSTADANGNSLGETGMSEARALQKFQVAVDTTNNINTGIALYNPDSQSVSLAVNLLDPDGNVVAAATTPPLAPGAQSIAWVSDLFPGTAGVQGSMSFAAGGSVGAAVAAVTLRQNPSPVVSAVPVAELPLLGPGITVTPALDKAHQATAAISPAGGALALTDSKGNKFTLTIPAKALLNTETVTMTAVSSLSGLPAGGGFAAGVQLDPDGLVLYQPATLNIEPAAAVSADTILPLGWHSTGQGLYLNAMDPRGSKVTFLLSHFSGAAIGMGTLDYETSQLLNLANIQDLESAAVAYWLQRARRDTLMGGGDPNADMQRGLDLANDGYQDVARLMQLGLSTGDADILRCASAHALAYQRMRQLLGLDLGNVSVGQGQDPIAAEIAAFVSRATAIVQQQSLDNCKKSHDPAAGLDVVETIRELALTGNEASIAPFSDALSQCSPQPLLTFQSEIVAVQTESAEGLSATLDAKVSGRANLDAGFVDADPMAANGEGYVSLTLSGSGPLTFDSQTVKLTGTPLNNAMCTASAPIPGASAIAVVQPSEIQYKFTPKFNPVAVRLNGQLLAEFCPVFDKAPVSVSLVMIPNVADEKNTITCHDPVFMSTGTEDLAISWTSGWLAAHPVSLPVTPITNWQIPGANSLAHKDISQTVQDAPGPVTEKTTLDLGQQQ